MAQPNRAKKGSATTDMCPRMRCAGWAKPESLSCDGRKPTLRGNLPAVSCHHVWRKLSKDVLGLLVQVDAQAVVALRPRLQVASVWLDAWCLGVCQSAYVSPPGPYAWQVLTHGMHVHVVDPLHFTVCQQQAFGRITAHLVLAMNAAEFFFKQCHGVAVQITTANAWECCQEGIQKPCSAQEVVLRSHLAWSHSSLFAVVMKYVRVCEDSSDNATE